jgi:hypothetical protein
MREGTERLLEVPCGLAVRRPRQGLLPRLSAVCQGLVPYLAPQGMLRQAFHLIVQPVARQGLPRLDNARVQRAPPALHETLIGHLLREGVLEGVGGLGQAPRLVEELRRLKLGEAPMQPLLVQLCHSL